MDKKQRTNNKSAIKKIINSYSNKKATIKKDKKSFQYAVAVVLNHGEIKKDPQRLTKIKTFVDKYNWDGINYLSE